VTAAAATVYLARSGQVSVREQADDAALDSGIWIFLDRQVAEQPRASAALDASVRSMADATRRMHRAQVAQHGSLRLRSEPVDRAGRQVGVAVASASTAAYDRVRSEALAGSVIVALLVLAGSYPVLRLAAARALRPVDEMTTQAADWSAHALTERFGPDHQFREIQTLAQTLDGVLDRLGAAVRHERRLPAELSHELRTPLARIVAETDLLLARQHDAEQLEVAHRAVRDTAVRMNGILDTLLAAARAEVQDNPGTCALRPVVDRLVTQLTASRVPVTLDIPPALDAGVDRTVVERIVAPLLDNAVRYARSTVCIAAERRDDAVHLDVIDDGPGIAEGLREAVFEPGRRGDPNDGHDGAGLGLALARRLARAAAGDVIAVTSDTGTVVRVVLPPG
jgi:signal transduction histidine kinase